MNRYSDLSYLENLPIITGINVIHEAQVNKERDDLYRLYVQQSTMMDEKTFLTFDEYYKKFSMVGKLRSNAETIKELSKEDVMRDVESILNNFNSISGGEQH